VREPRQRNSRPQFVLTRVLETVYYEALRRSLVNLIGYRRRKKDGRREERVQIERQPAQVSDRIKNAPRSATSSGRGKSGKTS